MDTLLVTKLLSTRVDEDYLIALSMVNNEADMLEFFWIEIVLFKLMSTISLTTMDTNMKYIHSNDQITTRNEILDIFEEYSYQWLPDSYYNEIFKEIKNGYTANS